MGTQVVRYESGQTPYPFEEMADSGDNTLFSASFAPISQASGFTPSVCPYGLKTGGTATGTTTNDQVAVAAMTLCMPGSSAADANGDVAVAAGNVTITRATGPDTHIVNSVIVNDSGALAVVSGTGGTSFSETRDAAGGPPLIPVDAVEVGQVRTTSNTAGVISSSEIFQVPGLHQEKSSQPGFDVNYFEGQVAFKSALPAIHTGPAPKKVYIKGATPIFANVPFGSDYTPAETTYSVSSTDTYDGPVGTSSASLNAASFTGILEDGVTDDILQFEGQTLWFEYLPDRDVSLPKQLTQGIMGFTRDYAAGGTVNCTFTVSPSVRSKDITS